MDTCRSNLRNSSQSAQPTETEGWRIVSYFFLSKCSLAVDMFYPWSILNFKEKSGRVSIPFQVMLGTNTLVWKTHCLANMAMEGDISSKEILRIGMFRTPFSCGYYQQHIFCKTKIILSCLFLHEAHGLEYLYYRPIIIKYHGNTCIKI